MDKFEALQQTIKNCRRSIQDVADDIGIVQHQLVEQEKKLASLSSYQTECKKGYASLPDSPFYYAQRRECKLLMEHLDEVLNQQQQRVEQCHASGDQCSQRWQQYTEQLQHYETQLEALNPQVEVLEQQQEKAQLVNRVHRTETDEDNYPWIHVGKKF